MTISVHVSVQLYNTIQILHTFDMIHQLGLPKGLGCNQVPIIEEAKNPGLGEIFLSFTQTRASLPSVQASSPLVVPLNLSTFLQFPPLAPFSLLLPNSLHGQIDNGGLYFKANNNYSQKACNLHHYT